MGCVPHKVTDTTSLLLQLGLAGLAKPRTVSLETRDVATLVNFLSSQRSALSTGAAAWTPVCLPVLGSQGFLHAYVAGLGDDAVLALVGAAPDAFERFHASRARLEAALLEAGACRAVWKLTNAEIFVTSMAWGT